MKSIGVVIPFLNEEEALSKVVTSLVSELDSSNISYKILLVNDGSCDDSPKIADKLAGGSERIFVIHKDSPGNIGSAYKDGIKFFDTDLICWLPSDGEVPSKTVVDCYIASCESHKPSISYPTNTFEARSYFRGFLSKLFQLICRLIFSLPIRYFNGVAVYQRERIEELTLISNGFTINLELAIKYAIHHKTDFVEVPFVLEKRIGGQEKALTFKNIFNVIKFLLFLKFSSSMEEV